MQQGDEFLAAIAAEQVGRAQLLAQRSGHRDQCLVSRRMAVAVVQGLEVVEVEKQHGDRPGQALVEHVKRRFGPRPSVEQAGERVAVGQLARPVAVVADRIEGRLTTPCGGCRQRLAEFSSAATPVHVIDPAGDGKTWRMDELLPAAFAMDETG